jgi:hypothetical protein
MQSGITLSDGKELSVLNRWTIHILGRIYSKSIEDKAIAEHMVQRSDLEWVIVRPVVLHLRTSKSLLVGSGSNVPN